MEKNDHCLVTTNSNDIEILYFGKWTAAKEGIIQFHYSNIQYNACEFTFRGSVIRCIGTKMNTHGFADVYIDGEFMQTIDGYSSTRLNQQVLYQNTTLSTDRMHKIRIEVKKDRNPEAIDCYQVIECFESLEPVEYITTIRSAAIFELSQIKNSTKAYLAPDIWSPAAYAATSPESGVTLQSGVFNDCFNKNISYLKYCFSLPFYNTGGQNGWVNGLPASSEGRMIGGAANTLHWGERSDMRDMVNTIVNTIQSRQRADGYCLPYDESYMNPQSEVFCDERRNYDRVNLTKGLLAAGKSGNSKAYNVLRKFYDWLNISSYYPYLLSGYFDNGSSHNCNNGHAGGIEMYFSPVGNNDDLIACERYFVQDWWINEAKKAEPLCLDYYPYHVPHSYLILALNSWLDHYRATGAAKYIDAAKGFWKMVNENYEHVGGTISICEESQGSYHPKSLELGHHVGETCGSVFWAHANQQLLQFYPTEEKYANEIEKVLYNVILACQDSNGNIRYHNNVHGTKEAPQCQNTCCEVNAVPFIAQLPQYIYSTASDGLYVNLFSASTIEWEHEGSNVTLIQTTTFPYDPAVIMTVAAASPKEMKLRIRVPSWASEKMTIYVNGKPAVTGTPGTYASIDRTWSDNDTISFTPLMGFTAIKYTGIDQAAGNIDRYALKYGPIVMALNDENGRVYTTAENLPDLLTPEGSLQFRVTGTHYKFMPYWQIDGSFTCYPMIQQ